MRYASSCSGADFFAEAVDKCRGGSWTYLHAAEADSIPRKILAKAWKLGKDCIFEDAASPEASAAPECDLYMISPD